MLTTEYIEDFAVFYDTYKEHIDKHYQDFADTFGGDREVDLDIPLFQQLIEAGVVNFFVIKDDDVFIGYVSVTISPSLLYKGNVDCVIDHFYLVEEIRGKGFSTKILREIESQLKEDGVGYCSIGLPAVAGYDAFAKRAGYTKQSSVYYKKLGDN